MLNFFFFLNKGENISRKLNQKVDRKGGASLAYLTSSASSMTKEKKGACPKSKLLEKEFSKEHGTGPKRKLYLLLYSPKQLVMV